MQALSLLLTLLSLLLTLYTDAEADKQEHLKGFSVDLIHRDSPLSPFYNSSMTQSELIRNSFLRSMSRVSRFRLSKDKIRESAHTDIIQIDGSHLMKIHIGTPPVETWAAPDTGSDLLWLQCTPCVKCYSQKAPLFDGRKSSTYAPVSCGSKACELDHDYTFCGHANRCMYLAKYGDGSRTVGNVASDYISFGSQNLRFSKSVFGCGRYNHGVFSRDDAGLVGLGRGPVSLVSQLGPVIGRKFSYCLNPMDVNATSKLRFGEEAIITKKRVVSTPLLTKPGEPSAYYIVNLQGVTVGQKAVPTSQSDGKIIIDSGATGTYLEPGLYKKIEAIVKKAIGLKPVQIPPEGPFKLCYPKKVKGMDFVFHFNGANLFIERAKMFILIDNLRCLAIFPATGISIFGNVAQSNLQVEFDLEAQKVSFAPADCTKE